MVTENEIKTAFKKGAKSTCDIQKVTTAGTTCGRCLPQIDGLVKEANAKRGKSDQLKLGFE
jgi:nitrite reductase (NADH) large subunit